MDVWSGDSRRKIGSAHGGPEARHRVATGDRTEKKRALPEGESQGGKSAGQIVDRVEGSYRNDQVIGLGRRLPRIFDQLLTAGPVREQFPWVANGDLVGKFSKTFPPARIGTANQERLSEAALHERKAVDAIVEGSIEEEEFRTHPRCAITAQRA